MAPYSVTTMLLLRYALPRMSTMEMFRAAVSPVLLMDICHVAVSPSWLTTWVKGVLVTVSSG